MEEQAMRTRRSVLKVLALGAAAAALRRASPWAVTPPAPAADATAGPEAAARRLHAPAPWGLLSPLRAGDALALGWRVAGLSEVRLGAAVLLLACRSGESARVHLCRHEGSPRGMAHTRKVDLLVMNGGRGDQPTDEELGRVVLGLADVVAANEDKPGPHQLALARMMTHEERVRVYGSEPGGALA
jgi:hypothetical protein